MKSLARKQAREQRDIHLSFGDHKRIITFNKDDRVDALRHQFLRVFSDVLGGQVAPARVMLQRYHSGFQDFVDISEEESLEAGDKLKAIVKDCHKDKELMPASCPGPHSLCHQHATLTLCLKPGLSSNAATGPAKDHPIQDGHNYCLWNLFSIQNGALIQQNSDEKGVSGTGNFAVPVENATIIRATSVPKAGFSPNFTLSFIKTNNFYIKVEGNGGVTSESYTMPNPPSAPDDLSFYPDYFSSYTMFMNYDRSTKVSKYLGCNKDGSMAVFTLKSPSYPIPQCLFIVNEQD